MVGLLLKNCGWTVGDGQSFKTWSEPWLSATSQEQPMGPESKSGSALMVTDLLKPSGGNWNRAVVHQLFPLEESKILSIKSTKQKQKDHGEFVSVYRMHCLPPNTTYP